MRYKRSYRWIEGLLRPTLQNPFKYVCIQVLVISLIACRLPRLNKVVTSGVTTAPADPAMRGAGGLGGPKGPSKDAKTSTNIRKNPLAAGATPQTPPIYYCHHSNLLIHTWGGARPRGTVADVGESKCGCPLWTTPWASVFVGDQSTTHTPVRRRCLIGLDTR